MAKNWRQFIDDVANAADIAAVAEKCGIEVIRSSGGLPRALCPFHDDRKPSLIFYTRDTESTRDHFHCFACGAHGDAFTLVQECRGLDFLQAVEWIANEYGIAIPKFKGNISERRTTSRRRGLQEAATIYGRPDQREKEMLVDFAGERRQKLSTLEMAEVSAARGNKVSRIVDDSRLLVEVLRAAGVIRKEESTLGTLLSTDEEVFEQF
jgi:DNA primase